MAVIYIENKPYNAAEGKNLLETCLGLGFDIPYFCWHPAMGSVGACRQCAVKKYRDENDTKGKIVMSCMEPVADGLRISISDPEVIEFRASIIELLMTNHPHDCPVCDEGGECHLQDMTVMAGRSVRRFRFKKRTHVNQYLGPFISHEMNRCIQCYRCVRFYRDYAGGRDLDVFSSHNNVYFGRHEDGALQSGFSGNLVEVCPTGVFTDKTFKAHYTRKWDMQTAPSVCVHCGLGCNTIPGERYGMLRRIRNRYNGKVNGYFLCDRGRYGYEFVNSEKRIEQITTHGKDASAGYAGKDAIIEHIQNIIKKCRILGIGSPRASLESNYALRKLVGEKNFYAGMSDNEHRLVSRAVHLMQAAAFVPSMKETEKSDAVLVLGEDVANTAPMLSLSLRQTHRNRSMSIIRRHNIPLWDDAAVRNAIKEKKGALFVLSPYPTKLDEAAALSFHASPADIADIGFAIAGILSGDPHPAMLSLSDKEKKLAEDIASELKSASNPLIVSGTGCLSEAVMEAAALIAGALSKDGRTAGLFLTVPECNSAGAAMLGGESLSTAFKRVNEKDADTVIILENDLYRRAESKAVDKFLAGCKHVIVLDTILNATAEKAGIVLPAASFAEADGTFINNECRGQRFYRAMEPAGDVEKSWLWLAEIMEASGFADAKKLRTLDGIIDSLAADIPFFTSLKDIAPKADFRSAGQKIPRQPHRYSGRTAVKAHIDVHEQKPVQDNDSALAFSMEGYSGQAPASIIPFFWSPGWNSDQSVNNFQAEIGGSLRGGDPGVRIAIASSSGQAYTWHTPEPAKPGEKKLDIIPYYTIFGSEELSALSSSIADRIPAACILLNPDDAQRIGIADGAVALMRMSGIDIRMPVKIDAGIPEGAVCYPLGMPGTEFIDMPAKCELARPE